MESLVSRIKQGLAERIYEQSRTARLHQEGDDEPRESDQTAPSCLPAPGEIRAAIDDLPIDTQRAIEFVHVKGGSIEQLAKSLGPRGIEKAQARLKRGYESLSLKLDLPFPDSFSLLRT